MPPNPDFLPPPGGLKAEMARMLGQPRELQRPLLVLAGWRAPGWPARSMARRVAALVGGPRPLAAGLAFTLSMSFGAAAARAIRFARARWPSHDGPIDIVGISMGGLIARAAAIGNNGEPPLRIGRLFTLGTPHRGARLAPLMRVEPLACAMCPGSEFLTRLDAAPREYDLICYARLRDSWVGAQNAAPPWQEPFWKDGPLLLGHQTISLDGLIRADIARRLRGEAPLAVRPSKPPRQ